MTRVLLLGSSGFIGGHVLAALDAHPRVGEVVCLRRAELDLLTAGVDDLCAVLERSGPDVVVNCTGRLDGSADDLMTVHALVTARLLDAIARCATGTRLVRLGSAGEYGPVPHGTRVREGDATRPVGPYGVSHLAATELVRTAVESGSADAVSLRVFNPIGAGAQGESLLVRAAERIAEALRDDRDQVRMGPLSAWRDLVDARDVATAVAAAATVPVLPSPVVNVGRGQAVRIREVVAALAGAAGFAGRVVEDLVPPGRSRGVDWTCADTTVAEQGLGWSPRHGLGEAVEAIWRDVGARAPADAA